MKSLTKFLFLTTLLFAGAGIAAGEFLEDRGRYHEDVPKRTPQEEQAEIIKIRRMTPPDINRVDYIAVKVTSPEGEESNFNCFAIPNSDFRGPGKHPSVDAVQKDLDSLYNFFTRSMTNMFGKVSLKRFNEFLQRL